MKDAGTFNEWTTAIGNPTRASELSLQTVTDVVRSGNRRLFRHLLTLLSDLGQDLIEGEWMEEDVSGDEMDQAICDYLALERLSVGLFGIGPMHQIGVFGHYLSVDAIGLTCIARALRWNVPTYTILVHSYPAHRDTGAGPDDEYEIICPDGSSWAPANWMLFDAMGFSWVQLGSVGCQSEKVLSALIGESQLEQAIYEIQRDGPAIFKRKQA